MHVHKTPKIEDFQGFKWPFEGFKGLFKGIFVATCEEKGAALQMKP